MVQSEKIAKKSYKIYFKTYFGPFQQLKWNR